MRCNCITISALIDAFYVSAAPAVNCDALVHPRNTISSFGRENMAQQHICFGCT